MNTFLFPFSDPKEEDSRALRGAIQWMGGGGSERHQDYLVETEYIMGKFRLDLVDVFCLC